MDIKNEKHGQVKHTPGPWTWRWETADRDWAIVVNGDGSIVANVNTETGPDAASVPASRKMPAEANARLIAAAPALVKSLEKIESARIAYMGDEIDANDRPSAWETLGNLLGAIGEAAELLKHCKGGE